MGHIKRLIRKLKSFERKMLLGKNKICKGKVGLGGKGGKLKMCSLLEEDLGVGRDNIQILVVLILSTKIF